MWTLLVAAGFVAVSVVLNWQSYAEPAHQAIFLGALKWTLKLEGPRCVS
ncbi:MULTISPECIES: hypothetical protein [Sphingobium]|nr:hypothetical protein [Sphingobium sp. MI1205]